MASVSRRMLVVMEHHIGPQETGRAHPSKQTPLSPELVDVALIDAKACAAVGAMSVSWWHEEVAAGRAPQPVIRAVRCTRWRLADVRAFWQRFAEQGADSDAGAKAATAAKKASAAAKLARASTLSP